MRRFGMVSLAVAVLLVVGAAAKEPATPKYKNIEIKHFTGAEGVELTAEFYDFLYAELKNEVQKKKLFAQVTGEGEVVDSADAPVSVVLEGSLEEYKKGSVVKSVMIGFGSGRRSLHSHIKILRVSDKQVLLEKELTVKTDPRWDNKRLARELAQHISGELKKI